MRRPPASCSTNLRPRALRCTSKRCRDLPRRRRPRLLRRREPERGVGSHGRATWASTSFISTCTRPFPAPRRRWARRRAGRRPRHPRALPPGARGGFRGRGLPTRLRPAEVDRQGARVHWAVRRLRALLRLHPSLRAGAPRDVGGGRAQRELHARATPRHVRPPSNAYACTSSSCLHGG